MLVGMVIILMVMMMVVLVMVINSYRCQGGGGGQGLDRLTAASKPFQIKNRVIEDRECDDDDGAQDDDVSKEKGCTP